MLHSLKIQNFALIDRLNWKLSDGFSVITGETGSGKSLVVEALKMILGEKIDAKLIRYGETECLLEAVFIKPSSQVEAILSSLGIAKANSLIIRRIFTKKASKQWINDCAITLKILKEISPYLLELNDNSQKDKLISSSFFFSLLDEEKECQKALSNYQKYWQKWKKLDEKIQQLESSHLSLNEIEFLRFQIKEIKKFNLKEAETIKEDYQRLNHQVELLEESKSILSVLQGNNGIIRQIIELKKHLQNIQNLDKKAFSANLENLESLLLEIQDLEEATNLYSQSLDLEGENFASKEQQIHQLEALKQKHGGSLESLCSFFTEAKQKLEMVESYEETLQKAQNEKERLFQELEKKGKILTQNRLRYSPILSQNISEQLSELGFPKNSVQIQVEKDIPHPLGINKVQFLFSPNTGEPPKPIGEIASSGEAARVIIALRNCLNQKEEKKLILFDEVDANIGGEIANAVGEKMKSLARKHQVIVITHFPQVAAHGEIHYQVEKISNEKTQSTLKKIEKEERITELTRMLGNKGKQSEKMARELLKLPSISSVKLNSK